MIVPSRSRPVGRLNHLWSPTPREIEERVRAQVSDQEINFCRSKRRLTNRNGTLIGSEQGVGIKHVSTSISAKKTSRRWPRDSTSFLHCVERGRPPRAE